MSEVYEATDAELAVARIREILKDPDLKDSWLSVTTRVLARDLNEAVGNYAPDPYVTAAENILSEAVSARRKFAPFNSAHEGYAVIAEEVDELWDDVKANRDTEEHMIAEAIQVGAMAVRFIADMRAKAALKVTTA